MSRSRFRIRAYAEADLEPVVALWHRTKRRAYPYLPLEQARTLEEDREFFRTRIAPQCRLWLCELDGVLQGFLAIRGSYLDRLYVDPDAQRRGVGSSLVAVAVRESPGGVELHTHVQNHAARAFYEKLGFRAAAFGTSPPPECAPDVEYRWRPPPP